MLGRPLVRVGGMFMEASGGRPVLDQKTIGAQATAGSVVLGVADIFGGILNRTGPGGAFNDTWPDADTILAALDNPQVGDSWMLWYRNGVAFAQTFVAGVGIVAGIGTLSVLASGAKMYLHTLLSTKRTVILAGSTANTTFVLGGFSNSDLAKIMPGMGVTGTNVGASAVVTGVTPNDTPGSATVTVSVASTGTIALTALTFFPRIQVDAPFTGTN